MTKVITKDQILQYLPELEARQITRKQIASALGIDVNTLRSKIKQHGIELPKVRSDMPLAERVLKHVTLDELATTSKYRIAEALNIKQPGVCIALRKLGIVSRVRDAGRRSVQERCQEVIDFIEDNGGYVQKVIREQGFNIDRGSVYRYAKEIGFDLQAYRFAHRDYGHWTTLPGRAKKISKCDYRLQARCNLCGTIHSVTLVNLKAGNSTRCMSCAAEAKRDTPRASRVRCVETGETYRSITKLAAALGLSQRYQQLRLQLKQQGQITHDDLTYALID